MSIHPPIARRPRSFRRAMRRSRLTAAVVAVLGMVALAAAGCGGYSSSGSSPPSGSATPVASQKADSGSGTASSTAGIPQNNGGDQDADNNGGPSDGDGAI